MVDNLEACEAAENLIARFGDGALEQAEIRARELREEGHTEACLFWVEVKHVIRLLIEQRRSTTAQ